MVRVSGEWNVPMECEVFFGTIHGRRPQVIFVAWTAGMNTRSIAWVISGNGVWDLYYADSFWTLFNNFASGALVPLVVRCFHAALLSCSPLTDFSLPAH